MVVKVQIKTGKLFPIHLPNTWMKSHSARFTVEPKTLPSDLPRCDIRKRFSSAATKKKIKSIRNNFIKTYHTLIKRITIAFL